MINKTIILIFPAIMLLACKGTNHFDQNDGLESMTPQSFRHQVKVISSDEFQGRRPFTEGETITINYLEDQFKKIGVEPGNGTSYFQEVPMVEITSTPDSLMTIKSNNKNFKIKGFDDYVLWTQRTDSIMTWKDEELVFAGYGVVAPEYNWNDYEGLDVKGKIVLVLINDPRYSERDSTFFKGKTMTYYGRWTYKFEEAARHGAKGCFIIHDTAPAAYGFNVIQNYWKTPHLYLDPRGKNQYFCEGIGWFSSETANKILAAAGFNFTELQTKANTSGFKALPLNVKISTSMKVKSKYDVSHNVIGKITGTEKPDEYIIYSAHWDHLGIGKKDDTGDSIYNGAIDNASGTASLIELAKGFRSLTNKPKRTIVFLAVTAEEQGLWGSAYYAENPVYAKEKTVANINIDCINPWGKMKEVIIVGRGQSELEDYVVEEAKFLNRDVVADPMPQKGFYFRSDHFNFAKVGIPAIYLNTGSEHLEKGKAYGQQLKLDYGKRYHAPSDEYDSITMTFEGGVEDLKLMFQVGKKLSFDGKWPQWKSNSEFKAMRDAYKKD
jgi:Zn-dependent M28 family amino/carboxypeptidase